MKTDLGASNLSVCCKDYQIVPSAAALKQCFGFVG